MPYSSFSVGILTVFRLVFGSAVLRASGAAASAAIFGRIFHNDFLLGFAAERGV